METDGNNPLLSLAEDTQQNKADINLVREELREARREVADYRQGLMQAHQSLTQVRQEINQQRLEIAQLIRLVERLVVEIRYQKRHAATEREIHELHLQQVLLRREHRSSDGESPEEPPS